MAEETRRSDSLESLDDDTEFEPTADMYLHDDVDDERTLEEEEAMNGTEEDLDELKKEGDLPLNELLAMYGYTKQSIPEGEIEQMEDKTDQSEELQPNGEESDEVTKDKVNSEEEGGEVFKDPSKTYQPRRSMRLFHNAVGIDRYLMHESGDSEEDSDYEPEHWKKEINIGDNYQAIIPDYQPVQDETGDGLQDVDDPGGNNELNLWRPGYLTDRQVRSYNLLIRKNRHKTTTTSLLSPEAVRDDEQALYVLKTNDYDVDKAVQLIRDSDSYISEAIQPWSEAECKQFEFGLKNHGKNFYEIQKYIKSRTVKDVVQFYYFWKKTERRDTFIQVNKMIKRKPSQAAQLNDYMDRYLDEDQDSSKLMAYEQNLSISSPSSPQGSNISSSTSNQQCLETELES